MLNVFKRHSLITFFILAFVLAWLIKIPVAISGTTNIVLRLLPSFVPALAAILTATIISGRRGVGSLFQQIGTAKVSPIWYLITLLGPAILELLALGISMLFGNPFPGVDFPGIRLPVVILVATIFALGEELGWRGFAFPRLQRRYSALVASLLIGFIWWLWHMPEVLTPNNLSFMEVVTVEMWSLLQFLALSVLMAWVYNSTHGSVWLVALFHAGNGLIGQVIHIPAISLASDLYNIILIVAAIIVIIMTGPTHLSHKRVTHEDETSQPGTEERISLQGSRT